MGADKALILAMALPLCATDGTAGAAVTDGTCAERPASSSADGDSQAIVSARMINPAAAEIVFADSTRMTLDFYGDNIFRMFMDIKGGIIRDPEAKPEARILADSPRRDAGRIALTDNSTETAISTRSIRVVFDRGSGLFRIIRLSNGQTVAEAAAPVEFGSKGTTTVKLKEREDEYFYGGGVQNGRFSHKGRIIAIENTNNWTDGGVASPTPFCWSTAGYGVMWHTFKRGSYDFGATVPGTVSLSHEASYLDLFFMVDATPEALLADFYQLTGNPVLMPKFGFYEGHLNAYNRDYWKEDKDGILFEDGRHYKESQKDNGGTRESLNGEKDNYQFSARAVIDRYAAHDMPLGWLLPNDGYGAGYGQTESLDGNIANLASLTGYARSKGVEIGLWTQSDLHPKEGVSALLQRDIVKEVRDAGVRVLKTDVAWVGAGYSFGLNGIADVSHIMNYYGSDARPFIISLDGWAGTQRYAGVWTGDQTGGEWEYIRFHIPTYIGSGLSGQPNICSDMDGIFGGKNVPVNVRDFQWKTFTPMQLNMDGWGSNPKYPHILGEPAASINRWYLKMKSEFMPYTYSIAREAVTGKPMVRAMFLDNPCGYTYGTRTQYQFLYGPFVLVAPVYQATQADEEGNDIRDGIYLPEGEWVDYFTGDVWRGGRIINNFDAPLWKMPLFVKRGAILPMTTAHNNVAQADSTLRIYEVYPCGTTEFTEYDDDGRTGAYLRGEGCTTRLSQQLDKDVATIKIDATQGSFRGMVKDKATWIKVDMTSRPEKITARYAGRKVRLTEASSMDELAAGADMFFYEESPELNRFATAGSDMAQLNVVKNPVLHVKLASRDITAGDIVLTVKGYEYAPADRMLTHKGRLAAPEFDVTADNTGAYDITPTWQNDANADYYEIEFDGMTYSTIRRGSLLIDGLKPETDYTLKLRAVNADGASEWTSRSVTTKSDPLEFAIRGIRGETSCENQEGQEADRLFNFDEGDTWHTKWSTAAVPFDLTVDLRSINRIDRFDYLPRTDAGNGTLLKGTVYYSMDKKNWTEAGTFDWKGADTKTFEFKDKPVARYIRVAVSEAVGKFGSGREMYVFRVPGSESYIPGDINHDGRIDENDLTSYTNYTGLRRGDADFEGYISRGDLNGNGLIDAFDISCVGIELETGVSSRKVEPVKGSISITSDKKTYNAGETVVIKVSGKGLRSVNAISFALPYNQQDMEYIGTDAEWLKEMRNLTNDRLHTSGQKALYPTFVNLGEKPYIDGDGELMIIRFKAKRRFTLNLKPADGMLVDKYLNTVQF